MIVEIRDAPNRLHIDSVWMFISYDEHGNEGVCAAPMGDLPCVPMIAADPERLTMLRKMAKQMVHLFPGKRIRLIKLTTREEIEEITP